jgi:GDPmannose 4,6-dehydratase
MSKRVLITGITGQDGAYLAQLLLKKGYRVFGTYRRLSTPNFWRLKYLGIEKEVNFIPADLSDQSSIIESIKQSRPDELYNLAAQSYVGASFDQPIISGEITGIAVTKILESIRIINPKIKFYQASSSELYGNTPYSILDENTPFHPRSPYAVAKLYSFWMSKIYRDGYDMFCSNGILFNHESPLRGLEFVSRKISDGVARIKLGISKKLTLGNLDSQRDWGFAPEYAEGMWKILQQRKPDDFVLATGEKHTVKEFAELAFNHVNLDWKKYVKTDKKLFRVLEVNQLKGNTKKSKKILKWNPKTKFEKLVRIMVDEDMKRWTLFKNGKHFPWDSFNYIEEEKILFQRYLKTNKQ